MEQIVMDLEMYVLGAGAWGPVVYVAAMIVAIIISPIPSSPLAIFAGVVFGTWWGMLWTMTGAMAGAAIAFSIARILGRPFVIKLASPEKLQAAEKYMPESRLTWATFLLRLLPLPFFDAVSYAAGLTHISFRNFAAATFFGLLPLTFLFSYFGDAFSGNFVAIGILIGATVLIFIVFLKIFQNRSKSRH